MGKGVFRTRFVSGQQVSGAWVVRATAMGVVCWLLLLGSWICSPVAAIDRPLSVDELDQLDQLIVEELSSMRPILDLPSGTPGSEVISSAVVTPSITPESLRPQPQPNVLGDLLERSQAVSAWEAILSRGIAASYRRESGNNTASVRKLGLLHLGVVLRRTLGNRPFRTEIPSLASREACRADLALGRHVARLGRAQVAADNQERLLILSEVQDGLNCLSARQTYRFADALGVALSSWQEEIPESALSPRTLTILKLSILNFALLIEDAAKPEGVNALYWWLSGHATELGSGLSQVGRSLVLYDPASGYLVETEGLLSGTVQLEEILDFQNIGFGVCGFGDMLAAGQAGNGFGCGVGAECEAEDPESPLGDPAELRTDALETAYGYSSADLSSNCGSALGKGLRDRVAEQVGGAGGFFGCILQSWIRKSRDEDPAYCMLEAQLAAAAEPTTVVAGTDPETGLPIVLGVFGNEECHTDPLAQDNGASPTNPFDTTCSNSRFGTKKCAHPDFIKEHYQSSEYRAFKKRYTEAYKKATGKEPNWARGEAAGKASTTAFAPTGDTCQIEEEHAACTKKNPDGTVKITFDVDNNKEHFSDPESAKKSINHETAHAASDFEGSADFIAAAEHSVACSAGDSAACKQAEAESKRLSDEEKKKLNEEVKKKLAKNKTPRGPQDPEGGSGCSAYAEQARRIMACHGFDEARDVLSGGTGGAAGLPPESRFAEWLLFGGGDGGQGPSFPEPGNVDPSEEQFIQSQELPFAECTETYGFGVAGVDRNGIYVIRSKSPEALPGCSTQILCPAGTRPVDNGGSCRCLSGTENILLRDLGAERLCQTSDACFGDPMKPPDLGGEPGG